DGAGPLPTAPGSAVNATALDTHTGSSTGTNVQEASVDEPDLVKTAGRLLVRISDASLETYDVSGVEPRRLGVAPLAGVGDAQLLLSGGRVVVIGSDQPDPTAGAASVAPPPRTRVLTYDVDDPSSPTLLGTR